MSTVLVVAQVLALRAVIWLVALFLLIIKPKSTATTVFLLQVEQYGKCPLIFIKIFSRIFLRSPPRTYYTCWSSPSLTISAAERSSAFARRSFGCCSPDSAHSTMIHSTFHTFSLHYSSIDTFQHSTGANSTNHDASMNQQGNWQGLTVKTTRKPARKSIKYEMENAMKKVSKQMSSPELGQRMLLAMWRVEQLVKDP